MKAIFLYCFVWCILQNVGYAQMSLPSETSCRKDYGQQYYFIFTCTFEIVDEIEWQKTLVKNHYERIV